MEPSHKFVALNVDKENDLILCNENYVNETDYAVSSVLTTAFGTTKPSDSSEWEHVSGGFRLFPTLASLIENAPKENLAIVQVLFDGMYITKTGEAVTSRIEVARVWTFDEVIAEGGITPSTIEAKKYYIENDYYQEDFNIDQDMDLDVRSVYQLSLCCDDELALYATSRGKLLDYFVTHNNPLVRVNVALKGTSELRRLLWQDTSVDVVKACLDAGDFNASVLYNNNVSVRLSAVSTLSTLINETQDPTIKREYISLLLMLSYDDDVQVRIALAKTNLFSEPLVRDPSLVVRLTARRNRNTLFDRIYVFLNAWRLR